MRFYKTWSNANAPWGSICSLKTRVHTCSRALAALSMHGLSTGAEPPAGFAVHGQLYEYRLGVTADPIEAILIPVRSWM